MVLKIQVMIPEREREMNVYSALYFSKAKPWAKTTLRDNEYRLGICYCTRYWTSQRPEDTRVRGSYRDWRTDESRLVVA